MKPGSLVKYREREWILLPSDDPSLVLLRPIGGSSRETCGILKPMENLISMSLPLEHVQPAQFPLPDPASVQDHAVVSIVQEACRLLLRDGATPFRSLGHLSFRPRPYQFVPLIMALRLDPVRLLIADDVGIGKTIEAGLIARELLSRGEIRRIAVFCPPNSYLCEQWQKELEEKFHIQAVVIRSGTISRLERQIPPNASVFNHYRHFIASIDLIKSERYSEAFVTHCPDFVIVDEAHTASLSSDPRISHIQHQRHALVARLSKNKNRPKPGGFCRNACWLETTDAILGSPGTFAFRHILACSRRNGFKQKSKEHLSESWVRFGKRRRGGLRFFPRHLRCGGKRKHHG